MERRAFDRCVAGGALIGVGGGGHVDGHVGAGGGEAEPPEEEGHEGLVHPPRPGAHPEGPAGNRWGG